MLVYLPLKLWDNVCAGVDLSGCTKMLTSLLIPHMGVLQSDAAAAVHTMQLTGRMAHYAVFSLRRH